MSKAKNPFDQASRYLAKQAPGGFVAWLTPGLRPTIRFQDWLDTRSLPFPGEGDRTCDTVACLLDAEPPEVWWALVIEFEIEPDSEMFGRLLEFLGRLWRERRPPGGGRYQVAAAVVNLTGSWQTASRDLQLPGTDARTCLQVVERNLARDDAATTLAAIAGSNLTGCVLPFVPLMQGGGEAGTIETWKRLAAAEPDERRRGDYGGLALVFAEAAGNLPAWREALKGWNMRQSQQVLEWQEEARREGRQQGLAEERAAGLLRILHARFPGAVDAGLETTIRSTSDLTKLAAAYEKAALCSSMKEFRRETEW